MADIKVLDVYRLLPRTNCRQCGMVCMAFASALLMGKAKPEDCPPLVEDEKYAEAYQKLQEIFGDKGEREATGLSIDRNKCDGCGICAAVCEISLEKSQELANGKGPRRVESPVIAIVDGLITIKNPDACRRVVPDAPTCNACVDLCPTKALTFL